MFELETRVARIDVHGRQLTPDEIYDAVAPGDAIAQKGIERLYAIKFRRHVFVQAAE